LTKDAFPRLGFKRKTRSLPFLGGNKFSRAANGAKPTFFRGRAEKVSLFSLPQTSGVCLWEVAFFPFPAKRQFFAAFRARRLLDEPDKPFPRPHTRQKKGFSPRFVFNEKPIFYPHEIKFSTRFEGNAKTAAKSPLFPSLI